MFERQSDEEVLEYGVPLDWLSAVRDVMSDNALLDLADHLPAETAEALLELATGGRPECMKFVDTTAVPLDHPEAQRRFRMMDNVEELAH